MSAQLFLGAGLLLGSLALVGMAAAVFKMGWHKRGGGL